MKKDRETLQAVLLLDVDDLNELEPLTLNTHRSLIPLFNVPLIVYTIEWLLTSQAVAEILILGNKKSTKVVENYLNSHNWKHHSLSGHLTPECLSPSAFSNSLTAPSIPKLQFITLSPQCHSVGDALRELDSLGCIYGDFLLSRGGAVVSNIDISDLWAVHKTNRVKHRNTIMTCLYKRLPHEHLRRPKSKNVVIVMDKNQKILMYNEIDMTELIQKRLESDRNEMARTICPGLNIPRDMLESNLNLTIASDFVETRVELCSHEVLALFTENFDYQSLYTDFLNGILASEILSHQFYVHCLGEAEYLTNVSTPFLYDGTSKDMLQRWAFPRIPIGAIVSASQNFRINHFNQFVSENGVTLARTCSLVNEILLDSDVSVGAHSIVDGSVLGKACIIGCRTRIRNSYLFDHVVVGDGCTIEGSIIGSFVEIKNNCVIKTGSIIGDQVVLGPDGRVEECIRLASVAQIETRRISKPVGSEFGPASNAVEWTLDLSRQWNRTHSSVDPSDSEGDDDTVSLKSVSLGLCSIGVNLFEKEIDELQTMVVDEWDSSDNESEQDVEARDSSTLHFIREVSETLQRAIRSPRLDISLIENTALEINALKFACNMDISTVKQAIYPVIIYFVLNIQQNHESTIHTFFRFWSPLLRKFRGDEVETLDMIMGICADNLKTAGAGHLNKTLPWIMLSLYQNDVLSESTILEWWELSGDLDKDLRESISEFVQWLEEAEEHSD